MVWGISYIFDASQWLAAFFITILGCSMLLAAVFYVIDRFQTKHAIRRNYPLLGRFRYLFENLGEFFRQYFFSMDREELPFNRAQRAWVYRASKNLDNTQAFGSTKDANKFGNILFSNSAFPILPSGERQKWEITFGPDSDHPYTTPSIFNISGMSFGAISKPAVKALTRGAAKANCWMNTGEGGLTKWHLESGCDVVFQIGTAKYGIRDEEGNLDLEKLKNIAKNPQIKMFEIKLSQGAKPGKGGILPAVKVTEEIAAIRGIPVGKSSISPNRHPEISSNMELLAFISQIKEVTGKPVGIKFVLGDHTWLDSLFTLINEQDPKCAPDFITLDGGNGGTGAAPMTLIDDMGASLPEALPVLTNKLVQYNLKGRIKVIASGKLINPVDIAWALCTGADCINSARGFMFSLGCIQALQCNKNTCPTGITTHDKSLQRGLVPSDKAKRVAHFHANMIKELDTIAHSCGVNHPGELSREHARLVVDQTKSIPLTVYYNSESFN